MLRSIQIFIEYVKNRKLTHSERKMNFDKSNRHRLESIKRYQPRIRAKGKYRNVYRRTRTFSNHGSSGQELGTC